MGCTKLEGVLGCLHLMFQFAQLGTDVMTTLKPWKHF